MAETRIILLTALRRELAALAHSVPAARAHVVGPRAARLRDIAAIAEPGWLVVLAGLAGAMDPKLRIGDVIVDDGGKILTAASLIASPAQKAEAFARSGALAVDMEADAVHAWATSMRARFLHVRAISDTADQMLDPALLGLLNPSGGTRWPAAIAYAISHPRRIGPMLQIARDSNRALRSLARALPRIVQDCQTGGECRSSPPVLRSRDRLAI